VSVTRRFCIKTVAGIELNLFAYMYSLTYAVLGELGYPQKQGCFSLNFDPNSVLRKFRHGTPTVGECDINSDSGRPGVDSTWRRRADVASAVYGGRLIVDC